MVEVALVLGWKSFDWWRRQRRILDEGNSGQGRMRKESKGHVLRWVKNVYIEVPGRADFSQKGSFKKDVGWFTELPRWLKKQAWRLCSLELYWSLRWGTTGQGCCQHGVGVLVHGTLLALHAGFGLGTQIFLQLFLLPGKDLCGAHFSGGMAHATGVA